MWIKPATNQQAGDSSQAQRAGLAALGCRPRACTASKPLQFCGRRRPQGHCRPRPQLRPAVVTVRGSGLCLWNGLFGISGDAVTSLGHRDTHGCLASVWSGQRAAVVTYGERGGSSGSPVGSCVRTWWGCHRTETVEPSGFH